MSDYLGGQQNGQSCRGILQWLVWGHLIRFDMTQSLVSGCLGISDMWLIGTACPRGYKATLGTWFTLSLFLSLSRFWSSLSLAWSPHSFLPWSRTLCIVPVSALIMDALHHSCFFPGPGRFDSCSRWSSWTLICGEQCRGHYGGRYQAGESDGDVQSVG